MKRLEEGLIRVDGSMGFLIAQSGIPSDQSFDAVNLTDPGKVTEIHKSYIERCQVDIIETNTFGANRSHLTSFGRGYEHLVAEINRRGVEIARGAVEGTHTLVGGAIGPITHSGEKGRASAYNDAELRTIYREQIEALGHAGVDAFMIETVHRHAEGLAALEIARELFPAIPVVFQVGCASRRGNTFYGDDVETLIRAADDGGAHVIGLNCFLDPAEMYAMVLEVREWTAKPLSAQPNIGRRTVLCEGVYKTDRSILTTVSVFGRRLVDAGVRVIGGCCGMAPVHIEQLRNDLTRMTPEQVEDAHVRHLERFSKMRKLISTQRELPEDANVVEPRSLLEADVLSRDVARRPILVELDPPRVGHRGLERALEGAELLAQAGLSYFTVADNPGRKPRLSRDLFAHMLKARVPGCELVMHVACADKTLVAFASEMESMRFLSNNILVISGDPPNGDFAISSAPYDLRSVKGIRAYTLRNHGISVTWEDELDPTAYYVGGAFNSRAIRPQIQKLTTKTLHAGAAFVMTQPIFDVDNLEETADALLALRERVRREQDRHLAVFPGVMQITTERNARILRKSFGMPVAKKTLRRLAELSRDDQKKLGRDLAVQVLEAIRHRPEVFDGLYIIPQFHAYTNCIETLNESGWLDPAQAALRH